MLITSRLETKSMSKFIENAEQFVSNEFKEKPQRI